MYEMKVEPPIFNSKHAPITAKIMVNTLPKNINKNLSKSPESFKWDESSGEIFKKLISSTNSIAIINDIKANLIIENGDKKNIDIVITRFINLFKPNMQTTRRKIRNRISGMIRNAKN